MKAGQIFTVNRASECRCFGETYNFVVMRALVDFSVDEAVKAWGRVSVPDDEEVWANRLVAAGKAEKVDAVTVFTDMRE